MAKNQYPCTQQELYLTAETAWSLFLLNIGDFTRFRKQYSIEYYAAKMKQIEEAKGIKERFVLEQELKLMRKELIEVKKDVLYYTRCTKQFIKNAFPKSVSRVMTSSISKKNYIKAANNNWDACRLIIDLGVFMLEKYKNELMRNDNMPESFIEECKSIKERFWKMGIKYGLFIQNMHYCGTRKVNMNNSIYSELTDLLRYAQLIYHKQPDMQALFRFEKLLRTARNKHKQQTGKNIPSAANFFSRVAAMF